MHWEALEPRRMSQKTQQQVSIDSRRHGGDSVFEMQTSVRENVSEFPSSVAKVWLFNGRIPHFSMGEVSGAITYEWKRVALSLLNDATVSVVGSDVFHLDTNIGTLSTNATSLTVLLNATATTVQRLGRNLEFIATTAGTRTIRYQVLDGDGGNTTGPD